MKKYFMFFIVFVIFMCPSFGLALEFEKAEIVTKNGDAFSKTIRSRDNNFISVGMFSYGTGNYSFSPGVIKYSENGTLLWKYVFEGYDLFSNLLDVSEDDNGDIYVTGFVYDPSDAFIAKLDKDGNLLWAKKVDEDTTFGYNGNFNDLEIKGDKVYYTGMLDRTGVLKIFKKNGEQLFYKGFNENVFSFVKRIMFIENDYLLFGTCIPEGKTYESSDICIARFNENNEMLWHISYGNLNVDEFLPNILLVDNKIQLFVKNNTYGSSNYVYSNVLFDLNGNVVFESKINSLNNLNVSDGGILSNGRMYAIVNNISNNNIKSGLLFLEDDFSFLINNVMVAENFIITSINEDMNNEQSLFVSGCTIDVNGEYFRDTYSAVTYRLSYSNKIVKNTSFNGTFDAVFDNDKLVVTPNPSIGFEVFNVSVKDVYGQNVLGVKRDDKYYFEVDTDVNVSVIFYKVNENLGYTTFKKNKGFNTSLSSYVDLKNIHMFQAVKKYKSEFIHYYLKKVDDNYVSILDLVSNDGEVKNSMQFDDYIYSVVTNGNNIFVITCNNLKNPSTCFLNSVNSDLVLEKKVSIQDSSVMSTMVFLEFSADVDLFIIKDQSLYFPSSSSVEEYNFNLEYVKSHNIPDYADNGYLCDIYEKYCNMNLHESDVSSVAYDKLEDYVVRAKNYATDNGSKVSIELSKNNNVLFDLKVPNYVSVMNVKIIKNYIVAIANVTEGYENSDILVFDFKGKLVQTINDDIDYKRLISFDNGFITTSYDVIDSDSCEDEICYSTFVKYYSLTPNITSTGIDSGKISVPMDANSGETVTVGVDSKFGYTFVGLKITDANGNVTIVNGKSFVMPDTAVQIEPIFSPIVNPDTGTFISISVVILSLIGLFSYYFLKKVKVKKFST